MSAATISQGLEGLVAEYQLNEGCGTDVVHDTAGQAPDGQLSGGATWFPPCGGRLREEHDETPVAANRIGEHSSSAGMLTTY